MNAHIIGSLNYIIPLYLNINKNLSTKLHKVLMTAARAAIGSYCFKKSKTYILNKCKWLNMNQMILYSSLKFIHKAVTTKQPNSITSLYKNIFTKRTVVDVIPVYKPKNKNMKDFVIYGGLSKYNSLPKTLKTLSIKKFNSQLKIHLINNSVCDTMD